MANKFFVVALPDGYGVGYWHASGSLTVDSMHCTREGVEAEIERKNSAHAAQLALAASSKVRHREHAYSPRRSVRYFEPDAWA